MTVFVAALMCLSSVVAPLWTDDKKADPPSAKQFEENVWQRQPVALVKPEEEVTVSINMVDADLATLLQIVTTEYKANLVLLSGHTTKLTLRLSDVPLSEFIKHVCAMTGLSYLKMGAAYVIAEENLLKTGYPLEYARANPPPAADPAQEIVTEFYMTNFVNAQHVSDALRDLFGDGLTVVNGPASQTPTISQQDTAAVTGIASGVLSAEAQSTHGRLIMLRGPRVMVEAAMRLAQRLDYARPLVDIKVTIHDISNEALRELGLTWSYSDITITESGNSGLNFGSFARSSMSFLAQISALEKVDAAKLLASPNIAVEDGQRAYVLIGSRLNFPVLIGYTQANTPIFDRQEERVGIYLQVAASIAGDGRITLAIYPQVSTITSFLNVGGASYPQIATREAQTTLRVQSGETIVMAGMLRDEEVRTLERVPILSQIPVLGELFTRRKTTKVSSQVIITITPTIITPDDDAQESEADGT